MPSETCFERFLLDGKQGCMATSSYFRVLILCTSLTSSPQTTFFFLFTFFFTFLFTLLSFHRRLQSSITVKSGCNISRVHGSQ
jgi:hypothetical protein